MTGEICARSAVGQGCDWLNKPNRRVPVGLLAAQWVELRLGPVAGQTSQRSMDQLGPRASGLLVASPTCRGCDVAVGGDTDRYGSSSHDAEARSVETGKETQGMLL